MALCTIMGLVIALLTPVGNTVVPVSWSSSAAPFDVPTGAGPPPTLSISDVTIGEDGSEATFTVTRAGKTKKKVEVDVATSDIDATAGADYTDQAATLVFPSKPEIATETFTVRILEDNVDEPTEAFAVTLSNPVDATIEREIGVGTIVDNDTAGIAVDSGDGLFVLEGGAADSMSIVMQSQPTAAVAITVAAPPEQLVIDPSSVTFDPLNWDQPQKVAINAVLDGMDEDDPHEVPISLSVESEDADYAATSLPPILVAVGDADALLVTIHGPSTGATEMPTTFSAVVNAGGTGAITYDWTVFLLGNAVTTGSQAVLEFTPDEPGMYIVRALVGDEHGQNPAEFIEFTVMSDVSESTFAMDIVWLANEGITRGCSANGTEFCPDEPVSRGQMAAFLVRFLGLDDSGDGNRFIDDDDSIFEVDIAKLALAGITAGCNPPHNDRFCPNAVVNRGQMAAFVVRALSLTDTGGGNTFVDDDGSPFEDDIARLATSGITRGCNADGSRFCPQQQVTRGQMAAFLHRAAELVGN